MQDVNEIYRHYNIPGNQSPYPRDFILDSNGIVRFASTEYDPGAMIHIIESLLDDTTVSTIDTKTIPKNFQLKQIFPNPFNSNVNIKFSVDKNKNVSLKIYNINGNLIKTLILNKSFSPGNYESFWDGLGNNGKIQTSGIYIIQLSDGKSIDIKKLVLAK